MLRLSSHAHCCHKSPSDSFLPVHGRTAHSAPAPASTRCGNIGDSTIQLGIVGLDEAPCSRHTLESQGACVERDGFVQFSSLHLQYPWTRISPAWCYRSYRYPEMAVILQKRVPLSSLHNGSGLIQEELADNIKLSGQPALLFEPCETSASHWDSERPAVIFEDPAEKGRDGEGRLSSRSIEVT